MKAAPAKVQPHPVAGSIAPPLGLRVAAVLWLIIGIGCGVLCPSAIRSIAAGQGVPIVMGFPAYGNGPFEGIGIQTTVPLLVGFFVVCIAQTAAGILLWRGSRAGAILSLATIPFGFVYWWGFALPFPPVMAVVGSVLVIRWWRSSPPVR